MTDYSTNLAATEQIPFVELYRIARGYNRWYYTNYKQNVTFNGSTYKPASITRTSFKIDSNLSAVSCSITAAVLQSFADYVVTQPPERTNVNIYRAVSDDLTEYALLFSGTVTGFSFNDERVVTVKAVEKGKVLDQELQMVVHSAACNHNVFYGDCKLDPLLWKVVTSNTIFSESTIVADVFGTYDDDYFTGGEVHIDEDARLITKHTGNTLYLQIPFSADLGYTGAEIEVYPGCDRKADTCLNKFNNLEHFLGMPYIPDKNPAIWGV